LRVRRPSRRVGELSLTSTSSAITMRAARSRKRAQLKSKRSARLPRRVAHRFAERLDGFDRQLGHELHRQCMRVEGPRRAGCPLPIRSRSATRARVSGCSPPDPALQTRGRSSALRSPWPATPRRCRRAVGRSGTREAQASAPSEDQRRPPAFEPAVDRPEDAVLDLRRPSGSASAMYTSPPACPRSPARPAIPVSDRAMSAPETRLAPSAMAAAPRAHRSVPADRLFVDPEDACLGAIGIGHRVEQQKVARPRLRVIKWPTRPPCKTRRWPASIASP